MELKQLPTAFEAEGLQQRPVQMAMIEQVYQAIQQQNILIIEAPTGTGKTISYCLGSYLAKKAKQKIIISTATIALQEQLYNKDLPLLEKLLGKKLNYAIAKGRRRYVCLARLHQQNEQTDCLDSNAEVERLQQKFDKKRWNGDRDRLTRQVDEHTWQAISTDSHGCHGKRCQFYDECAFFRARKRMHAADIIITNHNLLLSDFELGSGTILPEPEQAIYIIDECHHLPEKALNHFSRYAAVMGAVEWINGLNKAAGKAFSEKLLTEQEHQQWLDDTKSLVEQLKFLQQYAEQNQLQFKDDVWHIAKIEQSLLELAEPLISISQALTLQCQILIDVLGVDQITQQTEQQAENSTLLMQFKFLHSRVNNFLETWRLFCHQRAKDEAPIARWFSQKNGQFTLHCAPISVSKNLREQFWQQIVNGAILCSATIRSLAKFDDYRRKIGLRDHPKLIENSIESFFDYSRSVLFVPKMQHEPVGMQRQQYQLEVNTLLPQLILPNAGTLVLFTSKTAMEDCFSAMPLDMLDNILMQGDLGKAKIIERHKSQIHAGERSILFGLASFGEGLDLPAKLCQHVIINKLPFAVPTTPIELTRNDWLTQNQKNAFMLASLPAASLRLTQYVGRLIRQETDTGIVTILDKRLYSKKYGNLLLDNLPQFTSLVNQSIEQLKATPSIAFLYEDKITI